jgi:hypothetical protein
LLLLTAGHCVFGTSKQTPWYAKNEANVISSIGNTYGYVYPGKDAGAIRIDPSSYWATKAPIAAVVVKSSDGNPPTTYNPNYTIKADSKSSIGQILCMTGRTTGTHCGEVIYLGEEVNYGQGPVYNLGVIDECISRKGDSGGPWYKKHRAYGIHSGSTRSCDDEFYQGIRGAENDLNVDILLTP